MNRPGFSSATPWFPRSCPRDGDGGIFHTYSTSARGLDMLNAAHHYLDIVPKGRGLPELLPRAPLRSQLVRADIDEGWPAGWWRGITRTRPEDP